MLRRLFAMSVLLIAVSVCAAQDPAKSDKTKTPEKEKPKAGPTPDAMVDQILQRMDKNKDGKISKAEAEGPIADNFDRIDTNKDGFLDRKELLEMAKRRLAMQAMQPGGGRPPFPGGPGFGRPDPNDFDALDKNADGRLTRAELKGTRFEALFDQIDTNKDGKIDPKEWEAWHNKSKGK
jgi:Ca2+-binding EF-hand superfamily protein